MGVGEEVWAGIGLGCICLEIVHLVAQDLYHSGGFAYGDHHSLVSGGKFGSDRVVALASVIVIQRRHSAEEGPGEWQR